MTNNKTINFSELNEKEVIKMLFQWYASINDMRVAIDSDVSKNLFLLYYSKSSNNLGDYSKVIDKFKSNYIYNESEIEIVHNTPEINGLSCVYDYLVSPERNSIPNIYILLKLHQILFSKVPHPEFGGSFRNNNVYLPKTGIDLFSWDFISSEIAKLDGFYQDLLRRGKLISNSLLNDNVLDYINDCLKFKCQLIKIHPFSDGNGRTIRALINLLFIEASLPPIYILVEERKVYQEAMSEAIINKDYSFLNNLYYHKICKSIMTFDETLTCPKYKVKVKK